VTRDWPLATGNPARRGVVRVGNGRVLQRNLAFIQDPRRRAAVAANHRRMQNVDRRQIAGDTSAPARCRAAIYARRGIEEWPHRVGRRGWVVCGAAASVRPAWLSQAFQWQRVHAIGVPCAMVWPRSVRWAKVRERTVPVLVLRLVPPWQAWHFVW
jgi:hypothetical protein